MSTFSSEEKALLQRVSEGDEAAFRDLFYGYADSLGTYVLSLTHSRPQAEEIVQDVFLKLWTNRAALAGVENFSVYLHVVTRNHTLNALRQALRQSIQQKKWEAEQMATAVATETADDLIQPEGLVNGAIDQLPSQQQRAWLLSRKQGMTHPQIADTMGISRETVKKYIMYANQSITRFIRSRFSASN